MDKKKRIAEKLKRIRELWVEHEMMEEDSPEHEALIARIRILVTQYQVLAEADSPKKKPK